MLFSFRLKSHPDKLLRDHLKSVAALSKLIVNSKYIGDKDFFSTISYLIGISHDFGKATTFFQEMLDNGEKTKYANHGFLSSLFGYYLLKNYLDEINKLDEFWYIPIIAWIVINKHHGDIKNIGEEDGEISKLDEESEIETCLKQVENIACKSFEEVCAIYEELLKNSKFHEFIKIFNNIDNTKRFVKEIRDDALKISRENDIKYYFDTLFFYSVLLDADKLDASRTSIPPRMELPKDLIEKYKKIKFGLTKTHIAMIREEAYREVQNSIYNLDIENERILSINLPTGIGKTIAGLSFALNLREKVKDDFGFTPRIIYSLPFLSIIDQTSEVIKDILIVAGGYDEIPSNLFLKHHHLADIEYKEKEEKESELNIIEDISKALLLTEGWHSEIVITTFVQFFHSLITNKNKAARKFHNMLNSIIILDEVQSIPHKYWLLVNKVLNYLAKNFNCWIILMTATQPLIFEKREIKSLIKNREEYFELLDRVMFEFDLNAKEFEGFKEEIFNRILNEKDKDLMIVLNTIYSCKEMYCYLKEKFSAKYGLNPMECLDNNGICSLPDLELVNLSTHILPDFRLGRINRINQHKGKRKVIVTTQLVEAGVDISVDIIYRDFAPLDCIIQTAGRCNRNDEKEKGVIKVIRLKEENRTFCSYIYDSLLLDATGEVVKDFGNMVSEKSFTTKAADKYYTLVVNRGSKDKSEEVMDHIKKLNFSDISKFGLIEEKLPAMSIFVEVDERAENIRKKIEEIMNEKKDYERGKELLALRRGLNSYSLSIRGGKQIIDKIKTLPSIGEREDFRYVARNELKNWYNLDTGFNFPESDIEMRIV